MPRTPHIQLTATSISMTRGTTRVLHDVNLTVREGSRIGVVGENGRGKSTLLHVLAGKLSPDEGTVQRIGTLGMAEQEMSTEDQRTVGQAVADSIADSLTALADLDAAGEALADGQPGADAWFARALEQATALDAWDAERRIRVALEALRAEPNWSRPLAELSVGQRYRVRLACLLGSADDFLLLDEPTNHLDSSGLEFLTSAIKEREGGVVIVSHDRALLADVVEQTIDLDPTPDGTARVYGGGYAGYREGRRAERERWEQDYARQQEERTKLKGDLSEAQNRLVSGWRPDKGTGKHTRATRAPGLVQSVKRRQEALEAHAVTVPEPPLELRFPKLGARAGATLLVAEGVRFGGRLDEPVTMDIEGSSKILVTGPNGIGKSTLLGMLAGDLEPSEGRVRPTEAARISFLHQESTLPLEKRAAEVFKDHVNRLVSGRRLAAGEALSLGSLGLLKRAEASKRIGELSLGQRRRLDLAMVLAERPNVLLLDEPTNQLSIALVDELTEALEATGTAVVLSTHDRKLLRDLGDWQAVSLG